MPATELTAEEIADILGDTRSRGEYAEYMKAFIESGVPGIEVDFSDPLLAGKDPKKAKTGFDNVKKSFVKDSDPPVLKVPGANLVKVALKNKGSKETPDLHLYLINAAAAQAQAQAA